MTKLAEQIAAAAHECDDPECPCDPATTIYTSASTGGVVTLIEGPPETIAAVVQPELDQRDEKITKLRALWTAVAKTSQERKAEADGRRQHAEKLKTENEQLRERAESAERMAATAMETVGRLQREERTTEQLRAQQEARAEQAEAKVASLLHDMATVARHIEDGEYGDADKAARWALGVAPGVDLPGRES